MAGTSDRQLNFPVVPNRAITYPEPGGSCTGAEQFGSDEDTDISCYPCEETGQYHPASGYCINCNDFLCQLCFNCHKTNRASRNHILVDKSAMPTVIPKQTGTCSVHGDVIEYFCVSCDKFGCSCLIADHGSCGVKYIPNILEGFDITTDRKEFEEKLHNLKYKVMMSKKKYQSHCNGFNDLHRRAKRELQKERKLITTCFDKLERQMEGHIDQVKSAEEQALKDVGTHYRLLEEDFEKMFSWLERQKENGQMCQLFVYMKLLEEKLVGFEKRIVKLNEDNSIRKYELFMSEELRGMLDRQAPLAVLHDKFSVWNRRVNFCGSINMESEKDERRCNIKGMCVLKEFLVACDLENACVKLVKIQTTRGKVESVVYLSSWPWDVTKVTEEQVAATVPNLGLICFLSLKESTHGTPVNALVKTGEIYVGLQCRGIAYSRERLIVSFSSDSGMVKILTLSGTVLHRFITGPDGKDLFYTPRYVALGLNENIIYVSDSEKNSVTSLDRNGMVKDIYRHDELRCPAGMVVDRADSLFICGPRNYNVHQVYSDLSPVQILLNHSNAEEKPQSMAYCRTLNMLLIGMEYKNCINVFRLF